MDFQILLSPAEDFEGDIVLALSVRPVGYGLRKVDQRRIVKLLASYHWPSGKAVSCLQRTKESTGYGTQRWRMASKIDMLIVLSDWNRKCLTKKNNVTR